MYTYINCFKELDQKSMSVLSVSFTEQLSLQQKHYFKVNLQISLI